MLRRLRVPLTAAVVIATAALVLVAQTSAAPVKLFGTVGPGFTISLKNASHARVTTLKRGSYAFVVSDKAGIHNFTLKGPVSRAITGTAFVGTKTVVLTLKPGKYTYLCTVHPFVHGTFTVK